MSRRAFENTLHDTVRHMASGSSDVSRIGSGNAPVGRFADPMPGAMAEGMGRPDFPVIPNRVASAPGRADAARFVDGQIRQGKRRIS